MNPPSENSRPRRPRLPGPRWLYAFVPYKVGEGQEFTLLPLFIVQVLGGTVADVGVISSIRGVIAAPSSVLWGHLSDRLGRRSVLLLGFVAFGLTSFLLGVSNSLLAVLLLSVAGAVLAAGIEPAGSALVVNSVSRQKAPEALGRYSQIGGWSVVVGLLLGTAWLALLPPLFGDARTMRGLFFFAGSWILLSFFLGYRWVPEPERSSPAGHGSTTNPLSTLSTLVIASLRQRRRLSQVPRALASAVGLYYLCSFLWAWAYRTVMVPFPIFLSSVLGRTNSEVFFLTVVKSITDALLYLPVGRRMQRESGTRLHAMAAALQVGIFSFYVLLANLRPGAATLPLVGLAQVLTGFSFAVMFVCGPAGAASLLPRDVAGRAMGIYNAISRSAMIAGALAGGYTAEHLGYQAVFAFGALGSALAALLFWRLGDMFAQAQSRAAAG